MSLNDSSQNRVAVVTGASRGIGAAIATALGETGAAVVGTATTDAGARAISARLKEESNSGRGARLDVNDPDSVDALVREIVQEFGAPTILVNNAGITRDNIMLRMKEDEWSDVVNTNLNSVFRLSRACLRGMTKARWGRIINISSVVGSMGNAGQSNYAATKAGIAGFSRSLAKETGGRGITVNTIAPGFIDTDMTRVMDDSWKAAMLSIIPAQRFGKPEEIAAVVAFLASESAAYINGETIHVNGGMYMS